MLRPVLTLAAVGIAGFAIWKVLWLLLLPLVGAFMGFPTVIGAALYTMAAGGILALLLMLGRGVAAQAISNLRFMLTSLAVRISTGQGGKLEPLQATAARMPYALAIAMGTAAALIFPLRF